MAEIMQVLVVLQHAPAATRYLLYLWGFLHADSNAAL
jgi:hypothetical protein